MREQDLIRRYFTYRAGSGVRLGIGDDAAVLTPPPGELVMSTDTLNAGVHFFADDAPCLLARKAAAVSLSDIAAMGGAALWLTAALTAPAATAADWFESFARGLRASSEEYAYSIVGGDLTCGDSLSVTTTVIGVCRHPPRTRAAAQAGDEVWVSGRLGAAAHALRVRLRQLPAAQDMRQAERCLHEPQPRLRLAAALTEHIHAMMDISDGLAISAATIAAQSAVRIVIDVAALPPPPSLAVLSAEARQQCQLAGGDDYELLFTAPAAAAAVILQQASAEVPLTRIGKVVSGSGMEVQLDGEPLTLADSGYQHTFA